MSFVSIAVDICNCNDCKKIWGQKPSLFDALSEKEAMLHCINNAISIAKEGYPKGSNLTDAALCLFIENDTQPGRCMVFAKLEAAIDDEAEEELYYEEIYHYLIQLRLNIEGGHIKTLPYASSMHLNAHSGRRKLRYCADEVTIPNSINRRLIVAICCTEKDDFATRYTEKCDVTITILETVREFIRKSLQKE